MGGVICEVVNGTKQGYGGATGGPERRSDIVLRPYHMYHTVQ